MRASGILMHITSLPGPYGIGTLGSEAKAFVDFLHQAGQSYWQILPLNPTGYGDSPYQSFSTFAGNPYLISPEKLETMGLLLPGEAEKVPMGGVDFGYLYNTRFALFRKAFSRFVPDKAFADFCKENAYYLEDYALFMALKGDFSGASWLEWPEEIRLREPAALRSYKEKLQEEITFWCFLQYLFSTQWQELKRYAADKGIKIIGDVPIYVSLDSCDVWANPGLFCLDQDRRPTSVAGCPPDYFSADGQLWGNPLYRWEAMEKDGFLWWQRRLTRAGQWYDVVRLDHFRGFAGYWSVPAGDSTARNGRWLPGPGMKFVNVIKQALPQLSFIAEDLGLLTEDVHALRNASGWPGMKVLEFAFDSPDSEYLPHRHIKNSVCYLGTHDNATALQYLTEGDPFAVAAAKAYLGLSAEEGLVWGMLRGGMATVSDLFIAQMQDYLELGAESRMNCPGENSGKNWTWRCENGVLTTALAERIRELTTRYGRA